MSVRGGEFHSNIARFRKVRSPAADLYTGAFIISLFRVFLVLLYEEFRFLIPIICPFAGIKIMTNKPFLRSSSNPSISNVSSSPAFERVSNPTRRGSDGSQKVNQRHVPSSQTVLSPLPYWVAEGVPFVAHNLPSGEVQMVPVQTATPTMQGMVPVMATPGAATSQQTGN